MQPLRMDPADDVQKQLENFNYALETTSLSELKEAINMHKGLIQSSFTLQMAQTLSTLRDRVAQSFKDDPEKQELIEKLDTLQKTRLGEGVSEIEKKIDEIERNLPIDVFPPFKRDGKGNVIDSPRQLEAFSSQQASLATALGDSRYAHLMNLEETAFLVEISGWKNRASNEISTQQFIKGAHLTNDLNFMITFQNKIEMNRNSVSAAKEGRALLNKPEILKKLEEVQDLAIIGIIPPELAILKNLKKLRVRGLAVEHFPSRLQKLDQLTELDLSGDNQVRGSLTEIPAGVMKLKNLTRLEVNHQQIKQIPSKILELDKLKALSLDQNNLKEIPLLPNSLIALNLNRNQLENIDLSNLKFLNDLYVANNSEFIVYDTISNCQELRSLSCSENQIAHLPLTLDECPKLMSIRVIGSNRANAGWDPIQVEVTLQDYILNNRKMGKVA